MEKQQNGKKILSSNYFIWNKLPILNIVPFKSLSFREKNLSTHRVKFIRLYELMAYMIRNIFTE